MISHARSGSKAGVPIALPACLMRVLKIGKTALYEVLAENP